MSDANFCYAVYGVVIRDESFCSELDAELVSRDVSDGGAAFLGVRNGELNGTDWNLIMQAAKVAELDLNEAELQVAVLTGGLGLHRTHDDHNGHYVVNEGAWLLGVGLLHIPAHGLGDRTLTKALIAAMATWKTWAV
jgi:hypothetical protein